MAGAILTLLSGCAPLPAVEKRLGDGLTIVLPGIDGRGLHNENICQALVGAKTPTAVKLYDWTAPGQGLLNQVDIERNRAAAVKLAGHIQEYRQQYPGRPVYLVGLSGGTAIAVWAAEAMPEGQEIDGVILMGSSLSRGYDLTKALANTRRVVNFHSSQDAFLGIGCAFIGTMDRKFTEAAGNVGFAATSPKLTQVPYDPGMAKVGHDGSHLSYCGTGFVMAHVAPLIQGRPSEIDTGGHWFARLMISVQEKLHAIYRDDILPGITGICVLLSNPLFLRVGPADANRPSVTADGARENPGPQGQSPKEGPRELVGAIPSSAWTR
ncbi:MAG: alpha/beta hydrolase [Planctomycetota bacterium]